HVAGRVAPRPARELRAPARRKVDERASGDTGTERVVVLEIAARLERRLGEPVYEPLGCRFPGESCPTLGAKHERLRPARERLAGEADADAPRDGLEQLVARRQRRDADEI